MLSSHFIWPHGCARALVFVAAVNVEYTRSTLNKIHFCHTIFYFTFVAYILLLAPATSTMHEFHRSSCWLVANINCTFATNEPKHFQKRIQWYVLYTIEEASDIATAKHRIATLDGVAVCFYTQQHFTQIFRVCSLSSILHPTNDPNYKCVKMIYINMLAQLDMNGI